MTELQNTDELTRQVLHILAGDAGGFTWWFDHPEALSQLATQGRFLLLWNDEEAALSWGARCNVFPTEEMSEFDFTQIGRWLKVQNPPPTEILLEFWNLMDDLKRSIGEKFVTSSLEETCYYKLCALSLPDYVFDPIRPAVPAWTGREMRALRTLVAKDWGLLRKALRHSVQNSDLRK